MDDAAVRGQLLARARRRRGLSQTALAGLVGRSESWLSQVERGLKDLDSHSVLVKLARVLRVQVEELTGEESPDSSSRYSAAAEIERAMMGYDALDAVIARRDAGRPPALENLRQAVSRVNTVYQAARYDEAGRMLPRLIQTAEVVARTCPARNRKAAYTVRAETYQAATALLNRVGEPQLAWMAGNRSVSVAEYAEDGVLAAVGAYRLGYVFVRHRRTAEAKDLVIGAADALQRTMKQPTLEQLSLRGSLYLVAATASAREFDRAEADRFLGEAKRTAELIGNDRNDFWTAFGPTNVRIHEMSAAVAFGDARLAIETSELTDASSLPSGLLGRRCQVNLDLARAYAQQRKDAAAVNRLLDAERISPELVRYNDRTRELLTELLRREHRPSTPELRPLAQRAGLI